MKTLNEAIPTENGSYYVAVGTKSSSMYILRKVTNNTDSYVCSLSMCLEKSLIKAQNIVTEIS